MKNLTQEAIGAATTLAICAAVDSGALVATGAFCAELLGSRLPDADQLGARIHRRTHLERRSLSAALAGGVLRLPMTIFAALAKHRGATHWLLSGAAATIVLAAAAGASVAGAHVPRRDRDRLRLLGSPARRRRHAARRPTARALQCPARPSAATRLSPGDRRPRRPADADHSDAHSRRPGPRGLQSK